MRALQIIISAILLISLSACFSSKEDPLEKERKEFIKSLEEDSPLALYKGIKVSIRSLPLEQDYSNLDSVINDENSSNVPKYTLYLVQKILDAGKEDGEISIIEGIKIMKAFSDLKNELKNSDEDTYPTIFEVLLNISKANNPDYSTFLKLVNWNNPKEHAVLSALLMAAKPLPPSFQLYEVSKLNIEQLEKTEIKPLAAIIKGGSLMKSKWYYLAEEAFSQGLNSLDNDKLFFLYNNYPSFFGEAEAKVNSKEAQIVQLHAITCLLRGYVRTKIDDEEKNKLALEDFELFLKDAEELGLDNELVWFAGAYVNIKKENSDKAIVYLKKFQNSELITDEEKAAVNEIISYLEKRESDKALNTVYDKLFIGKLVTKYITNYVKGIDWYKEIEKSETGRKFLEIPKVLDEEYKKFDSDLDTDKLKEKGKELIKDIF